MEMFGSSLQLLDLTPPSDLFEIVQDQGQPLKIAKSPRISDFRNLTSPFKGGKSPKLLQGPDHEQQDQP